MRLYPVLCLLTLVLVATACGSTEPGSAPSATPAAVTTAATVPNVIPTGIPAATATSPAPTKTTVTLDAHEAYSDGTCWAADVQRAYFACKTEPFRLIRFDPATNTHTTYTAPSGYNNAWGVCTTGGKVYVPSSGASGADHLSVSVFNTSDSTPSLVAVYEYDAAGSSGGSSIATDGTYLYIGAVGLILMVRLSDMALMDTLTLTHSRSIHAIGYNATDGFLYAGGIDIASKISIDRDEETLTETVHYHHNCGTMTDDVAFSSTDLWLGPENGSIYGQVLLIPLSKFDSHELVTLGPTAAADAGWCQGSFMDSDGLHMWTAWATSPGQLTRTKLSDMTSERIWLATGENYANEIVQYDTNKYLIVTWSNPGKVINLTNPFSDELLEKPPSDSNYSYWVPLRLYVETTPEDDLSSPRY